MKINGATQIFGQDFDLTLLGLLGNLIDQGGFRRISVCAAYATLKGVTRVRSLMTAGAEFRWILGLDDAFTEPEALLTASGSFNSELRTSKMRTRTKRIRFHPKIYFLDQSPNNEAALIIGSSNLTDNAMVSNCEAFSVTNVSGAIEIEKIEQYWNKFWTRAKPFERAGFQQYILLYHLNRKRNRTIVDDSEEDNSVSFRRAAKSAINTTNLAWIELGTMTGYHAEQVDVVRDLAPFLGIAPGYKIDEEHTMQITSVKGTFAYTLMFKKGMWRFMDIQQGFRQPLKTKFENTSRYILVIQRNSVGRYLMHLVEKNTPAAARLIERSTATGFVGKSTPGQGGRTYGWQ